MLNTTNINASPDYLGLVKFLLEPLLDKSDSLSLDCELLNNSQKVWIRLAVTGDDQGKVFGRGMRNLEAVKTILQTAATSVGQSVHLELYGRPEKTTSSEHEGHSRPSGQRKPPSRRPSNNPKPSGKPRH
jgi:uncharacterized protein